MFTNSISKKAFSAINHTKVAVVGAGCGGQSLIAQLARSGKVSASEITVFDPSSEHHYQPGYTSVAGGVYGDATKTKSHYEAKHIVRRQDELLAQTPGVNWQKKAVTSFNPSANEIALSDGTTATYDVLVVNPGLALRYDQIKGAQEAIEDQNAPVSSMYTLQGAYKTSMLRDSFRGGNAIFTCPVFPIKCGGAPQKILYLSESTFRANGVRDSTNMKYYAGTPVMFPPNDDFNAALNTTCQDKGIDQFFKHSLVEVDKDNRVATFKQLDSGDLVKQDFDMLHIVPPQSAPEFVAKSELAHESGWLDVNINTLQHTRYANVFGHGDICNLPTPKTAAAVFSQTPVLVNNILHQLSGEGSQASYDGYAACPIFVGDEKLMLCEFKYGRVTATSLYADQTEPTKNFYRLKKEIFPRVYWSLMPKGKWFGANAGIFAPTLKTI